MARRTKRSAVSHLHSSNINVETNATNSIHKRQCRPRRSPATKIATRTAAETGQRRRDDATSGCTPSSKIVLDPEELVQRLIQRNAGTTPKKDGNPQVHYLTDDRASWYILVRRWWPCPSADAFQQQWELHPPQRHPLKLFGKVVSEKRWSQSWGVSYKYSGATNVARPIAENDMVRDLIDAANDSIVQTTPGNYYNAVLQNWYEPDDTIGKHADDESSNRQDMPIWSLSWGGTRRFLFRPKHSPSHNNVTELYLKDGDLLLMGGTCQRTHHHEVPKVRLTKDPPTERRINFTVRAFLS